MQPSRSRHAVVLAVAVLVAAPTQAFDLMQAWEQAWQHAPEADAARAVRAGLQAQGLEAASLWRPTVMFEGAAQVGRAESAVRGAQFRAPGFGTSSGVSFDNSVTAGIGVRAGLEWRQTLLSRERRARGEALDVAAATAEPAWAQARQALMMRAADLYLEVVLAQDRLRVLQRQQQAAERAAAEAADRFRLGDRPVIDVQEADARVAALRAERAAAEVHLTLARAALADLTAHPVAEDLPGPQAAPRAETPDSLGDWLARAQTGNPGLRLAEAQVQAAQAESRASAVAASPTVDMVARLGGERTTGDGAYGHATQHGHQAHVGVQLTVPLATGGLREAKQAQARAAIERARAERARLAQHVAQQVRAAWYGLTAGVERLQALERAWQASTTRLDATRMGLEVGDRTTLDLLQAQSDAAATEIAVAEARVRLIRQRLELAAAAGELDEAVLNQANALLGLGAR